MIRPGKFSCPTLLLALLAGALNVGAATNSDPGFTEVYQTIQAHVAGGDAAELNRAAVVGLLKELGPKASFVTAGATTNSTTPVPLVSKSVLFDGDFAYLRLSRVDNGLVADVRSAYQSLAISNKLSGVVLDLRFSDGADYAAAVAVTELFPLKKPATLDWGNGGHETQTGTGIISAPLVVLVNGETRAAAETLAALLRETGAGLILGNPTAGQALLTQDFPLSNGTLLRVATASVKLNGLELLSVRPDITVVVSAKDEQAFLTDAFMVLPNLNPPTLAGKPGGTNAPVRRQRLTEAALVRAHKQGVNPEEDEAGFLNQPRENQPEAPVVNDPALARALDLLKGLAIVRQSRR